MLLDNDLKRCPCCNEEKPRGAFYGNRRREDGLNHYCKRCFNQRYVATRERKGPDFKAIAERGMKRCARCKEEKPRSEFWKNRSQSDGLQNYCGTCLMIYNRARLDPEKEKVRLRKYWKKSRKNWYLQKQFGITIEQYNELVEKQNGVCAICSRPPSPKKELAVDHDHDTGRIRGLLCVNCNLGVGYFGDDIVRMERAIQYVLFNKEGVT